jgi:hypothetical protein
MDKFFGPIMGKLDTLFGKDKPSANPLKAYNETNMQYLEDLKQGKAAAWPPAGEIQKMIDSSHLDEARRGEESPIEAQAQIKIDELSTRFTQIVELQPKMVEADKIPSIADHVAPVLHHLWSEDRRAEKKKVWWRPAKFKDESEKAAWEQQFKQFLTTNPSKGTIEAYTKLEKDNEGNDVFKIDILNIPFDQLSTAWKNANKDAALRVATFVNAALENGTSDDTLDGLSEQVHEGYLVDSTNLWKLESVKQYGDAALFDKAITAHKSRELPKEEKLKALYEAAASLKAPAPDEKEETANLIKAITEVKQQFCSYDSLIPSEKLRDMLQVMAALEALVEANDGV